MQIICQFSPLIHWFEALILDIIKVHAFQRLQDVRASVVISELLFK